MTNFAKVPVLIDGKGLVDDVICADQEFIDSGVVGNPAIWIQTDFNARGGIYYTSNPFNQPKALRANYASIGYTYDAINDVFYAPQPFPSWTIGSPTWLWQPPVPYPSAPGSYYWDEATLSWVQT